MWNYDPEHDENPYALDYCELCGRECEKREMEYVGDGDNRVRVCPECACEAVECEECGKVTTDYVTVKEDARNEYCLCPECAAKQQQGIA